MDSKKEYHLADWKSICRPRKLGGLGIKPLHLVNQALLGKWLWSLGEEPDSLWFKIVSVQYEISRDGWDTDGPTYRFSRVWRGVMSMKAALNQT